MRRRQLNQPQCFSSGPSQLPNEGPAKSTATKSLKNSARQPLAELATHGAGQDSSPGQAVPCQPARTSLTSYTVALLFPPDANIANSTSKCRNNVLDRS
jgi:hypothetical protein